MLQLKFEWGKSNDLPIHATPINSHDITMNPKPLKKNSSKFPDNLHNQPPLKTVK